jgi:prepilin-type N-terminal cleavage/methylation domain-containing protein
MRMKAFTLIELLVVISIVAILVALAAPTLAGARTAARQTKSLVQVRTVHQLVATYANVSSDLLPSPVESRYYFSRDPAIGFTMSPWDAPRRWMPLLLTVSSWEEMLPIIASPGVQVEPDVIYPTSSYAMVACTQAHPQFWMPGAQIDMRLGGNRQSDVAHPGNKVFAFDVDLGFMRSRRAIGLDSIEQTPMAFFDGHGALKIPYLASVPFDSPALVGLRPTQRLYHTFAGIRGTDY